ncbi:methyl-accepting chemotaxis protein [Nitrosopumilus ureiphilus]|uniref:Chemotaxis protein n=1 Tax=Nitrosopumilus ureiphilus TaxID=1470067 RepID=A0A7D5M7I4_9ARCH|nr:methyl-accepting chemotaxis protein [Nitrosopumilus ureiphilus]QLH06867.1 chemotaxis protein [Nitrosopumilus ureiphilus]
MTIQTTKIVDKKTTKNKSMSPTNASSGDETLTTKVLRSFDEAVAVSEQLSGTVAELESATKSQTSGIEEISQSIQSIATAIQGVASNATKAMEMMRQSEQITQTISTDAEKGMSKMDSMKSIVSESSNDVKKLATELAKVDNMTGFITQIAEQTNLLALNAAIEAARAGDVGRGFAVVADEVRRLAENSKKGAEDISELISSLKDSSDKTTDSIEKGNSVVQDAYDVITNILASIKDIATSITEVVSQMQEISAATEQVSSGTEEATAASEEILSVAQTNLKSFEEIVIAKDKETQTLHDANSSAKTLAEITDVLDTSAIVSITDIDGMINYMNKFFLDVARFPTEELMGESHRILKSGWHDPGLFDLLWKTISGGKMFQGYVRNRAKDGSIYWVKTAISPTYDENHNIKGYVGVRTPITELMVMIGVEGACRDMEAGKPVKPHLKAVVEKLRVGDYQITNNV